MRHFYSNIWHQGGCLSVHFNFVSWTLHAMWYGMQRRQEKIHQFQPLVSLRKG